MSVYYYIACKDCKKDLFIGDSCGADKRKRTLFITSEKELRELDKFLLEHENHNLTFGDDNHTLID